MKAIIYEQYGSPDVLQLKEVEKPTPKDNEVLIKVHAAAANPLDWHRMRGAPFLVRLSDGLLKPKNKGLGADIAGQVEAVGSSVVQFQPGDEVFGDISAGGFAEYVCVPENLLTLKPANLSFEEAASVPVVALTALQGLRDTGQIQPGQKVLINGASGGVGTFAVQLAKSFGGDVTGVCSMRNLEMVRSIGADQVIDYTQEDFTKNGQRYDLVYDAVGNRSVSDYKRALKPNGQCVVAGFTTLSHLFQVILLGAWVSRNGGQKIGIMGMAQANKKDLLLIKELLEAEKVAPVIDRCYPLNETAEAIRYLEEGHARGKVVITVEQNN
jgi:NADPH:quinone reductase-like Zn-dependent oxidoreductase